MSIEKVVLLVEDSDDDVELTLRSFKKQKLSNRIVVVKNGLEALDYLFSRGAYSGRDNREQPILVLLDLKLPGVDGIEVLRQIRGSEQTKRTPVVILTTSSEYSDRLKTYDLGANSYVRKPVDFDQFLEAARQLGLYWLLLNEPPPLGRE